MRLEIMGSMLILSGEQSQAVSACAHMSTRCGQKISATSTQAKLRACQIIGQTFVLAISCRHAESGRSMPWKERQTDSRDRFTDWNGRLTVSRERFTHG